MANTNSITSKAPYYDDFDASKDYIQVLFRPGYPVQARELTTLQTFVKEQIHRFGNSIWKEGSIVKNAAVTLSTDFSEIILEGANSESYPSTGASGNPVIASISTLIGKIISNEDGSVKAQVVESPLGVDESLTVGKIYVKYITSGTFSAGGYIYAKASDNVGTLSEDFFNAYTTINSCVLASVDSGTFYVNGRFTTINKQSIVITNTSDTASFNLGFEVDETILTQNDDSSLFDNARGVSNEGAPGAHRLKYNLTLAYRDIDEIADSNFYRVASYIDNQRQDAPEIDKNLELINDLLARRTFDESGDYAVTPFNPSVGAGDSDSVYGITISPAKAYVKGYEINKPAPTKIYLERIRDTKTSRNYQIPFEGTTVLRVTSPSGTFPGMDEYIRLKDSDGTVIGVARGYSQETRTSKNTTYIELHVWDIRMFTILRIDDNTFRTALTTGCDVRTSDASAYIYTEENTRAGLGTNEVVAIASTGRFKTGKDLISDKLGSTVTLTRGDIASDLSDVVSVETAGGYSATVDIANTDFTNSNKSMFVNTEKWIKTLKSGGSIIDNYYQAYDDSQVLQEFNDQEETAKTLKFAYLKVRNETGTNYGWSAAHREISLHYPDLYQVYGINEGKTSTFTGCRFTRLDISTAGIIPVGSIITGSTSKSQAIVALSNASNTYETSITSSSSSNFHRTIKATGSSSEIEIIFQKGQAFTDNETLTVLAPASETAYNFEVLVNSTISPNGTDITSNFVMDDGQRSEYYDISRIIRKDDRPAPSNDIVVFFAYYDIGTVATATYYSADSYEENIYTNDPRFYGVNRAISSPNGKSGTQLRNGIDFRLRTLSVTNTSLSPFNFASRTFQDQTKIKPNTNFTVDVVEYLRRIDLVTLQKNGSFAIIQGVPAVNPSKPLNSVDGMAVFYVHSSPIVRYPEVDAQIEKVDNRRYTMRDIGDLERRINNIEKRVTLTFLELQTMNDDISGRTRSGFIVDNFSKSNANNGIADITHAEWFCEINNLDSVLHAYRDTGKNIDMEITSSNNVSDFWDGWILKDFTETPFSTQMKATNTHLINPFATWIYNGDIQLNPSVYNWTVPVNNYFTSLYGVIKPFEGNAAEFENFNRILTTSPGGKSEIVQEWIGSPSTSSTGWITTNLEEVSVRTTTVWQAQTTTETVTFDTARATGDIDVTKDTRVVTNTDNYWMPSVTINWTVDNLRPNLEHTIQFAETVVGTMTTNEEGRASGSFVVPAQTYKVGSEVVSFYDTETEVRSRGNALFTNTAQEDITNYISNTATEYVTKSTSTAIRSQTTERREIWEREGGDPVAQMFMLPTSVTGEKENSVITSLDLWFGLVDTRPNMNKVVVEIVNSANGYPTNDVIGRSEWVYLTESNETDVINDDSAINFKFRNPVVLRGDTEYAIVIKSPSDITRVYVAEIGQELIDGAGIHADQPNVGGYFGSFFTSQNATTWNAEQSKDLTYRLNRASFVADDATISLENTVQDTGWFKGDIGAFNAGLAIEVFEGCDYARVYHPSHGLQYSGAQVNLIIDSDGVVPDSDNLVYGISIADLNGIFDVKFPTLNSYCIRLPDYATRSGIINTGKFSSFATQDVVYDSIITNINPTKEEADDVYVTIRGKYAPSLNLAADNNKLVNLDTTAVIADELINIQIDRDHEFADPRIIRSATNATAADLAMTLTLTSESQYTSPIIRKGDNLNPIVFRNHTGNFMTDSDIESLTTTEVSGSQDDDVNQEFMSRIQAIQSEKEHSAYITKQIELQIPADGFTINLDADMQPGTRLEFAYKIRGIGDDTQFDEIEWINFNTDQQITEQNYGVFGSAVDFKSYTLEQRTNIDFTAFKLRIRMISDNEAQIPKIANLRIVADV